MRVQDELVCWVLAGITKICVIFTIPVQHDTAYSVSKDVTSVSADNVSFGLVVQYMMPDCCINICNYGPNLLNAQTCACHLHCSPSDRRPANAYPNAECQHNVLHSVCWCNLSKAQHS